jgi:3-hydroxyacyl-CoA dehydrogenase/enoyl-CoA hydratase/3-hydroxybutyryl-CoA epimerase
MDLMLTGRTIKPRRALAIGLVDRLADAGELEAAAVDLIRRSPAPRRASLKDRLLNLAPARPLLASQMRKQVAKRASPEHYPAPYALIDLWARQGASPATGYEAEARSISELFLTPTSRNLVRVFFLQERLKGLGGKGARRTERLHVVGAGVMGGDIAAWSALQGIETTLQDREMKYIEPALTRAARYFGERIKSADERAAALARLKADVEGNGVAAADLILEAIYENAEAKRTLYAQVEQRMKPDACLATNTSSLMIETLARDLRNPGGLVGLHFFNPVPRMPLVEVVFGNDTDHAVVQSAIAFTRQIDKLPLPCRSAPGFVVNRVLMPYMSEAMHCAREGMALEVIDRAAVDFGMPMGPVELADTVGLDVALHVGRILSEAFGRPAPQGLAELVEAGKLGKKSGEGFYRWQAGKAVKPAVDDAAARHDLADRLILPLVNECVAVLREGIVDDADLLDAGVIFGTGFAPFRGGPIAYARARGVDTIVTRLTELARLYGDRFRADPGWDLLR